MKIAIIGSGNVGKALAGLFVRAGHGVTLSAAHPEHARGPPRRPARRRRPPTAKR